MKLRDNAWLDVVTLALSEPLPLRVRGRSMVPTLRPGDEVLIESALAEALSTGDWIVVRNAEGGFLHRYLGLRNGQVLTKGDGHVGFDPLWMPEAVLGRVAEARRDGRCFYRRTAGQVRREKLLAAGHRIVGDVWGLARRLKALLLALFALFLGVSLVAAAVTLTDFSAEVGPDRITLKWETASETTNLGFYLWRSLIETVEYENVFCDDNNPHNSFIPSQDEGAGAVYECEDDNVLPGVVYYYKLQDLPVDGTVGDFTDPITASIVLPEGTLTVTPTLTVTLTATVTPAALTATPSPVPPPGNANVRFWADDSDLNAGECTTLQWQTENIKAVHLDGDGVLGDGAVTFCPCETELHVLSVTYPDDTAGNFEVTLTVTGECTDAARTATPTTTPSPTPTPDVAVSATLTLTPVPTATPVPTKIEEPSPTPSASPQPVQSDATAERTPTPSIVPKASATRGVVEGDSQGVGVDTALSVWLLVVGGIVGLGFVGAGIVMWKRQQ